MSKKYQCIGGMKMPGVNVAILSPMSMTSTSEMSGMSGMSGGKGYSMNFNPISTNGCFLSSVINLV